MEALSVADVNHDGVLDLVVLTADGCERLTPFPKELTAA